MTAAFEQRYRADPDPWRTRTSDYEHAKRHRTLAACGPGPFAAVCDLGAGLGLLSADLAPRADRLLALDGAPSAVAAAAATLAAYPDAEARVATLPDDLPPDERFDLIVASEILYYLDDAALTATLRWIDRALRPRGRLVAVHWTGHAADLRRDAAAVGAALDALAGHRVTVVDERFRVEVVDR